MREVHHVHPLGEGKEWPAIRDALRTWRNENERCSDKIVELGEYALEHYGSNLGSEKWTVYEQVCIAALDLCPDRIKLVNKCIQVLAEQFPTSLRVNMLEGLRFEYFRKWDKAVEMYDSIIEYEPTYPPPYKRKVAIYKAQNKVEEAVKECNKYLNTFCTDTESWLELSDLYISQMNYAKAAFCLEEVLIQHPHNHLHHQKYADVLFTIGGKENLEIASKYYAKAVDLNPNNVRALFGIQLSASTLASIGKQSSKVKSDHQVLATWATDKIEDHYREADTQKEGFIELSSCLDKLSLK